MNCGKANLWCMRLQRVPVTKESAVEGHDDEVALGMNQELGGLLYISQYSGFVSLSWIVKRDTDDFLLLFFEFLFPEPSELCYLLVLKQSKFVYSPKSCLHHIACHPSP